MLTFKAFWIVNSQGQTKKDLQKKNFENKSFISNESMYYADALKQHKIR